MKHFIGIDIGSTHVKACLTDEQMNIIKIATCNNRPETECDCGLCYDPQMLWNRICQTVRELIPFAKNGSICAIGVASMADSGLPVDEYGNGLYPIIPWNNNCGIEYKQKILEHISYETIYNITGQCYHPKFAISRILFLRENHPEIFKKMSCWLSVYDYVLFCLTGEFVTDSSMACRTLMYSIADRDWEKSLVEFADVQGRLPRVVEMGDQCGLLNARAAEDMHLPEGIPVICAGHDHLSAMRAVHLTGVGDVLNSLGTSEVFIGVSNYVHNNPLCMKYGINQGCFTGGKYYWMANLPSSGASVEWLRKAISVGEPIDYEYFVDEDKLISSNGVMYFPHINGSGTPHPNPESKGILLGLTSSTSIYNIIKAIYEGISFETRWILDSIEETFEVEIERLVAVSGGARNKPFMKTKADVTGRTYKLLDVSEVTVYGAVIQAAMKVGVLSVERCRNLFENCNILQPEHLNKREYDERYQQYRFLIDKFSMLFKD